jgi:hypothetical protein
LRWRDRGAFLVNACSSQDYGSSFGERVEQKTADGDWWTVSRRWNCEDVSISPFLTTR